jgi:hypothetical protein
LIDKSQKIVIQQTLEKGIGPPLEAAGFELKFLNYTPNFIPYNF